MRAYGLGIPKGAIASIDREKAGGMPCPSCGIGTRTIDTRLGPSGSTRRRRICTSSRCLMRFTTYEVAVDAAPIVSFEQLAPQLVDQAQHAIKALETLIDQLKAAVTVSKIIPRQ